MGYDSKSASVRTKNASVMSRRKADNFIGMWKSIQREDHLFNVKRIEKINGSRIAIGDEVDGGFTYADVGWPLIWLDNPNWTPCF